MRMKSQRSLSLSPTLSLSSSSNTRKQSSPFFSANFALDKHWKFILANVCLSLLVHVISCGKPTTTVLVPSNVNNQTTQNASLLSTEQLIHDIVMNQSAEWYQEIAAEKKLLQQLQTIVDESSETSSGEPKARDNRAIDYDHLLPQINSTLYALEKKSVTPKQRELVQSLEKTVAFAEHVLNHELKKKAKSGIDEFPADFMSDQVGQPFWKTCIILLMFCCCFWVQVLSASDQHIIDLISLLLIVYKYKNYKSSQNSY